MSASDEYAHRLEARRASLATQRKQHLLVGRLRAAVLAAIGAIIVGIALWGGPSGWWLVPLIAIFTLLGARLQRAEVETTRLERAVSHYERGLARIEGRWDEASETGERFADPKHLYARDLDLFGPASLFQLISGARTRMGEETLASWLLEPAPPDTVAARQECVRELSSRLDLREDLSALGSAASVGVHPEPLAAWGEQPARLDSPQLQFGARSLGVLGALAIAAVIAYLMNKTGALSLPGMIGPLLGAYFTLMASIAIGLAVAYRSRTEEVFSQLDEATKDLDLLAEVLARLEGESFSAQRLDELVNELQADGVPPSVQVAKLHRLIDLLNWRGNMIFAPFALFLFWDLNFCLAVEDWRRRFGPALRRWLAAVGEIEALSSFGALHYERPEYSFPEFVDEMPFFEGQSLAHPLLPPDEAIANDIRIDGDLRAIVVSGSNMSGKSTFLRTVGINTVLAQAGAPVRARRLRLCRLQVGASIQIMDSLHEGSSKFYAEITRLREIMKAANAELPLLFLIDEFFHGTNSHDRKIGAEAIVQGLVNRNAIGFITTHDLALAHIADGLGRRGVNVHFEDHLEDGKMKFDYRMRPGIVEKSNAVELMRSVGLEV